MTTATVLSKPGLLAATALLSTCGSIAGGTPAHPDVVFIAFDDLNDWIRPLDPSSPVAMPNLERLAARGVVFRRAYCAAPQCNPSRTALLSGRHPTTSGVYANASDWRSTVPESVMLPRFFRAHGYRSIGAGKIYHHVDRHFHDEGSFIEYLPFVADDLPPSKLNGLARAQTPDGEWETLAPTFDWGVSPNTEDEMLDVRSATFAADHLRRPPAEPLFLAVGFFRPHLPYFVPPRFLSRYDPANLSLPPMMADDLADVPAGGRALMKRWARMFRAIQQAPDSHAKWREAVGAYAAGATFADAQLGRILDALDASPRRANTIIVVWSDHGYHLGEKDHWTKFVLWEKATRVPLMIVAPGVTTPGTVCDRPVSLLDLYPTLIDLCGLPRRADLDGESLVPLLRDPTAERVNPVVTTEGRGNHAVRSDRWRLIHYADGTEELYDHSADPNEWTNLATRADLQHIKEQLRRWLPLREAEPAPDFISTTGTSS